MLELIAESASRWRVQRHGRMRVPAVVFASQRVLPEGDHSLQQLANVATLPGIVTAAYAMPDIHEGYGFPIGGVAATDVAAGGVVSPGGVGFDISCGVRLLTSPVTVAEVGYRLPQLMDRLDTAIPRGAGPGGILTRPSPADLEQILLGGSRLLVEQGFGTDTDLEHCEDRGVVIDADPAAISERAMQRGSGQVGSLGSGNHFLELQRVGKIYRPQAAEAFGLWPGQVCVMIHCGSRGLGHQICTDHVRAMLAAMPRHGITVPDEQLACAPVQSPEGQAYLGAMAAAANYGRGNRQMLTHAVREIFRALGLGELILLYDVSHNLAKIETHLVDGRATRLCVHRKGATRAFPPGHPDMPARYAEHGQPVLVPGSMGTASYVLAGAAQGQAFHSACHGAGRVLSRHASTRRITAAALKRQLEAAGIVVRGSSSRGLAEEAPFAYKDVDEVVRVCQDNRMADLVARLTPFGVVKG
jgi:tRNA-splicing ligase RtcB